MSRSMIAGVALALCLGFGGGYVARGSLHSGGGGGGSSPSPSPSIRASQEFVSVLTFCAHLEGFPAIERDLRKGRSSSAAKRLEGLSNTLTGDANLFDAAHDSATANGLRARARQLTGITTLEQLLPVEGTLKAMCTDLRTRFPSPSA